MNVPEHHDREQDKKLNLRLYLRSITEMGKVHYQKIVDNPNFVFDCLDPKFNFIAMNENGIISCFEYEPLINHPLDSWTNDKGLFSIIFHIEAFYWDWSKSLVKRPE